MVIALADWIKYKCRAGHYSPRALTGLGAFVAVPKLYDSFAASTEVGDQLFVHSTRCFSAWAIMYLTHGPWSHVGIISGYGKVSEAVPSGVGEYPLARYFDGRHYLLVLRLPAQPDLEQKMKAHIDAKRGHRYAYKKVLRLLAMTLCNEHPDYRIKFTIDILLALGLIAGLVPFHTAKIAVAAVGSMYLAVLGVNSFLRLRAALRLHTDYLEFASPQSHLPINSSPNRLFRILKRQPGVGLLSNGAKTTGATH